ncbi:uncharacterized protein LOC116773006 isoform X1 [Danaus plexippus]|nr:uncharacterized protein LOC116773006 isoform X1 [Danaus plexippus]
MINCTLHFIYTTYTTILVDEKMLWELILWLVACSIANTWANPRVILPEHESLASELSSRVMSRTSRLQDVREARDARFPLPSPQDLEAIRKAAQILIMIGEQVIPSITGGSPTDVLSTEIPNDQVYNNY